MAWVIFLVLVLLTLLAAPVVLSSLSTRRDHQRHEHKHQIALAKAKNIKLKVPLSERVALARLAMAFSSIGFELGLNIPDSSFAEIHEFRTKAVDIAAQYDGWDRHHSAFHLKDLKPERLQSVYALVADDVDFLAECAHAAHALDNYLLFYRQSYHPDTHMIPLDEMVTAETLDSIKHIEHPDLYTESPLKV